VPDAAVGQALSTLMLPERHGVRVLAIRRDAEPPDDLLVGPPRGQVLKEGDALLLFGGSSALAEAGAALARR
jgi:uncharacterized protein with PhoU and TrkA domain